MAEFADDATHRWVIRTFGPKHSPTITLECCERCGIIRREDRRNKSCPGVIAVEPRQCR